MRSGFGGGGRPAAGILTATEARVARTRLQVKGFLNLGLLTTVVVRKILMGEKKKKKILIHIRMDFSGRAVKSLLLHFGSLLHRKTFSLKPRLQTAANTFSFKVSEYTSEFILYLLDAAAQPRSIVVPPPCFSKDQLFIFFVTGLIFTPVIKGLCHISKISTTFFWSPLSLQHNSTETTHYLWKLLFKKLIPCWALLSNLYAWNKKLILLINASTFHYNIWMYYITI